MNLISIPPLPWHCGTIPLAKTVQQDTWRRKLPNCGNQPPRGRHCMNVYVATLAMDRAAMLHATVRPEVTKMILA